MQLNQIIKRLRGEESLQAFSTRLGFSISSAVNYERTKDPRIPPPNVLLRLLVECRNKNMMNLHEDILRELFFALCTDWDELREATLPEGF